MSGLGETEACLHGQKRDKRDESLERRLENWMKGRRLGMGHWEGVSGEGKARDEKEDDKCLWVQKKGKRP